MVPLLYLVFFLSGAAALVFEALWFYQAGLAFGNSVWASSLVLAGFMGGLALGNGLAGRYGRHIHRPLVFYALLELIIGITGVVLVVLLPVLTPWLAPLLRPLAGQPWLLNTVRLALSFLLLLVPATAMGATLPVIVAALFRHDPHFGRVLGRAYGWNTLGAVAGVLAAESLLVSAFGIRGSALVALLANVVAALAALNIARLLPGPHGHVKVAAPAQGTPTAPATSDTPAGAASPPGAAPLPPRLPTGAFLLLAGAFLSGGLLLALEVVWFRFLQLFLLGNSQSFAIMLAMVLGGIGLGGLAGAVWLSWRPAAGYHLPAVALAAGAGVVLLYTVFDGVAGRHQGEVLHTWRDALTLALPLILPIALLSGTLFTLLGEALSRAAPGAARAAGYLTLANTTGAMLGALAAGFLLLPVLGMERALHLLAAGYGGVALLLLPASGLPGRRPAAWLPVGATGLAWLAAVVLFPTGLMESRYLGYPVQRFAASEGAVPVEIREGLTETITYLQVDSFGEPFYHRMLTNSFSMSATHMRAQRYMKLFAYWPLAVHPRPRSALLICYGVGITAKALTDARELATIDVVDTSRDVLEMNRIVYPDPATNPLHDARVRVHVEDGRQFLQLTERRFDLITGEPPPPELAGVSNLYSREYFKLIYDRLADGGIATYWLPVTELHLSETKAIIGAFCDAFRDCSLWVGSVLDWMLVGTRQAQGPVSRAHVTRLWNDPVIGPDLAGLALEIPEQLGTSFLAGAEDLALLVGDAPRLDDDQPKRIRNRRVDPGRLRPVYRRWMEAGIARDRFAQSELIRRLWPADLRASTLASFRVQEILNRVMFSEDAGIPSRLPLLHEVLTTTGLTTLPLLLMDSSVQKQQSAERALARGQGGPTLDSLLGIRALAHRDYPRAADLLGRAFDGGDRRLKVAAYRLLALCMAGRRSEALRDAQAIGISASPEADQKQVWDFLRRTFGL